MKPMKRITKWTHNLIVVFDIIEKNNGFGGRRDYHLPEVTPTGLQWYLSDDIRVPSFVSLKTVSQNILNSNNLMQLLNNLNNK